MNRVEISVTEKFTDKSIITASFTGTELYVTTKAGFVATRFSKATHNISVEFSTINKSIHKNNLNNYKNGKN